MKRENGYFLWLASFAFLILLFLLMNAVYFLAGRVFNILGIEDKDFYGVFLNSGVVFCTSSSIFLYYSFFKKKITPCGDLGLEKPWQQVRKALFYFLIFFVMALFFLKIYSSFVDLKTLYAVEVVKEYRYKNPWLFLFFLALLPAFSEELFFRGLLVLGAYKSGKTFLGLFLSTLLFSLVHFNWTLTPYYFLVGLYLGTITLKTRSLIPPFIVHFLINASVVLVALFL